jgi:hypothetical protein
VDSVLTVVGGLTVQRLNAWHCAPQRDAGNLPSLRGEVFSHRLCCAFALIYPPARIAQQEDFVCLQLCAATRTQVSVAATPIIKRANAWPVIETVVAA